MQRFNKNILFAEDEQKIRESLERALEMMNGKPVVSCKNGLDALNCFNQNDFDLIVTDIKMPKMNGVEFAKEVRKSNAKTPIVFITADPYDIHAQTIDELGNTYYLSKPINLPEIVELLEEIANTEACAI